MKGWFTLRTAYFKNSTRFYNLTIAGFVLLAVLMLLLAESGVAFAHARLKTATVLPDATVAAAPPSLTLTFTEETSPTQTKLTVNDASGKQVDKGDLKVSGATATVSLGTLASGKYTVTFRSFTEDDSATVDGSYTFTVGGTAAAGDASKASQEEGGGNEAPAAPATGLGGATTSDNGFTMPALLGLGAIFSFTGVLLLVRRKRQA